MDLLDNDFNGFNDVIWSDETTVQLESHRRPSYKKEGRTSYTQTPSQAPHKTPHMGGH